MTLPVNTLKHLRHPGNNQIGLYFKYQDNLTIEGKVVFNTQNQTINAIIFYYEKVLANIQAGKRSPIPRHFEHCKSCQSRYQEGLSHQAGYPHILRHSIVTHQMEQGINLRYIQEGLGHASSRTTERYTHVAESSFRNIKNPVDDFSI